MYCPQCGTEAEENARFCAKCGRDLSGSTEQPRTAAETREAGPYVPDHLAWAILSMIFCCIPTGIVSIVYAAQVNGKVAEGDLAGAREASAKAKTWAWVSFGIGILVYVILPLYFILMLATF